jgi:hypothetical protein
MLAFGSLRTIIILLLVKHDSKKIYSGFLLDRNRSWFARILKPSIVKTNEGKLQEPSYFGNDRACALSSDTIDNTYNQDDKKTKFGADICKTMLFLWRAGVVLLVDTL